MSNLGEYPCRFHFLSEDDREAVEKVIASEMRRRADRIFQSGMYRPASQPGVEHFWLGDIWALTGKDILDAIGMEVGELDCVVGGPPCQGVSKANRHRGPNDPRNNMVFEFARLVLELRPKAMVMENVPEIATMQTPYGVDLLDAFCRVLADGGWATLDSLRRCMATTERKAALRNRQPHVRPEQPEQMRLNLK